MSGERGMYGRKDYPSAWTPGPLRRVAGEGQVTRPSAAQTGSPTMTDSEWWQSRRELIGKLDELARLHLETGQYDMVEWEPQPVRYHSTIEGQAVVEWFDDSDQS